MQEAMILTRIRLQLNCASELNKHCTIIMF